ncbi:MAG: hypothetical protein MJY45_05010 [Bacteroidales bacterium]|nr:hypothetical protein [Bacteroidales bacterium]
MFKDSVITAKFKKRELTIALVCFGLAFIVNVCCVIAYSCPWVEIFTQIGFVIVFALIFYALCIVARLLALAVTRLIRKCRG